MGMEKQLAGNTVTKTSWGSNKTIKKIYMNYDLYLLLLPALVYFIIFHYGPMYGLQIAFKDFMPLRGIGDSPWVGFKYFERFLNAYQFWAILKNTVFLSLYSLVIGFPIPIILSLLLNQINSRRFQRVVQTVTYAPNFISVMVIVGMVLIFLSPRNGIVNQLRALFGGEPIFFMAKPEWFRSIYVWSGIWQNAGFSMIVYLAALTSIDPFLHEAAVVDGANKIQRIWYIDIPGILPTISILLILNLGNIMSVGFEKVYLLQNPLNASSSEIIATYVYKMGLQRYQYSYSSSIGLFKSVVNCILLVTVNFISRKMGNSSLW